MDGVIVVNKPPGLSSSDTCLKVKKLLGFKKVGHLGTLDPLATGVLPLCINEGTKLVQFLIQSEKEYITTLELGIETDTQDSQGKILNKTDSISQDRDKIIKVIQQFKGKTLQTPPMFSAIKHNGVPLYKIARRGGCVPRKQREVIIHDVDILKIDLPSVTFRVVCSHGTYIRTLCHDIGCRLGCGAHLTSLERIRSGAFHIRESVTIDDFEGCCREELIDKHLISSKDALHGLPELVISNALEQKIRNGIHLTMNDIGSVEFPKVIMGQQIKIISCESRLIAIVESLVNNDQDILVSCDQSKRVWKILRVF